MKNRVTHESGLQNRRAFTLVELLVVIAIIAILAALLLPALGRSKATAQSAKCKSNLHELGLALRMYVDEYQKYPTFDGLDSRPAYWDSKLLVYTVGSQAVFDCPANSPTNQWSRQKRFGSLLPPNKSYGYNGTGEGMRAEVNSLGLDGGLGTGRSAGTRTALPESKVVAADDMIAIADDKGGYDGDADDNSGSVDDDADDLWSELSGIHNHGANVVFCDAHVEYARTNRWVARTTTARMRWNNDHLAHPEVGR